ncbi:uncharacterized protein [Oryza sativa Japonica Group]|uniref:Os02g0552400 protein n=2 Tax=Oryza sativa subsp. japonica TaxID=39947 RepID=A0A0P0VKD1_ORYSJ|nr:uncharacterized protein LOC107277178 isoform X1 [Oryza sativa Japonica Group]XP_052141800.1 uncharacterized protein LOC127761533 [Oryza glaberrima]BAS79180.1 Os02g0552400 [Oryza sativa Japonica Group]
MAGGGGGGAALAAAAWEIAVVFVLRPLLAFAFVLSIIALSWYVAWRTVLVHVPLVQEIAGLRRKKPVKPKPKERGRFARFYRSLGERNNKSEGTS